MFYSHEILTNRQYGVATIWLVATIGNKTGGKRVSKRAIQEVDVQRACEKIIEPGAPIALRLQGNLLYGVSRVYNQQCSYMLTDAHKIQSQMVTFFNQLNTNQLDPEAGKARRENIMIMDDPDFFPIGPLPELSPDMFVLSQHGNKTSSQMSPHSFLSSGSSSGVERLPAHLGLRHSSLSDPHNSPRGLQGLSSVQKPIALTDGEDIFGMNDMPGPIDWGMEIDADGNIIEHSEPGHAIFQDELELPPLPSIEGGVNVDQGIEQTQHNEQGDLLMMEERSLPDAEALPERQREGQAELIVSETREHQQPTQRQRRRKLILADEVTEVSRNVLQDWQHNYAENCTVTKSHLTSATLAKRNALLLTFGLGIAYIGQDLGIPGMIHPLAEQYSGDFLLTAYTGIEILKKDRGKRVSSSTEFIEDDEVENRRKRPRLEADDGSQIHGSDLHKILGDVQGTAQSAVEIGREAQPALDDHRSSLMPWNRGFSLMRGSSIPGSANPGRNHPSSPLKRLSSLQDIVRYSDEAAMSGRDDGGFDFGSGGDFHSDVPPFGDMPLTPQKKSSSQHIREALDRESQNFLFFIEEMVHENGELRRDEDFELQRKWIAFDDIFISRKTDRITAAQAFYHILTLVTKGKMFVEQDGANEVPFGGVHVGIVKPAA